MLKLPSNDKHQYERILKALYNLNNNSDFAVLADFLAEELAKQDKQLRTAESDFLRTQGRAQVLARILELANEAKPLLQKISQ